MPYHDKPSTAERMLGIALALTIAAALVVGLLAYFDVLTR